ncbi:MAG: hypothetical protein HY784_06220 [Chloroflexi bacterium]|nr:hypothetical protein [Chloroflexota bacterium]
MSKRVPLAPNGLPESSAWLFPEYDFVRMEPEEYAPVVMERVLERGSIPEVQWLLAHYGTRRLSAWLRRYGYRALSPRTFEYWRWVLGIKRFRRPPWDQGRSIKASWQ